MTSSPDDLAELRASVRAFLSAKADEQQVRAAMESERGYDDALWRQMTEQLGLTGLALPEE
jgi:alkylation response protein AidB-like acyl-CoA dehydrogenase